FPVDGLVFEGPCSEVFLDPGRHIFGLWLPMTNRRLSTAGGRLTRALCTAAEIWWRLVRLVLRRASAPQEGHCDKGVTYRTHRATPPEGFTVSRRCRDRKLRIAAAIWSQCVSSAKWPVSKKRTSAFGMSRLNASAPAGKKNGSFLPHTARNGGLYLRK